MKRLIFSFVLLFSLKSFSQNIIYVATKKDPRYVAYYDSLINYYECKLLNSYFRTRYAKCRNIAEYMAIRNCYMDKSEKTVVRSGIAYTGHSTKGYFSVTVFKGIFGDSDDGWHVQMQSDSAPPPAVCVLINYPIHVKHKIKKPTTPHIHSAPNPVILKKKYKIEWYHNDIKDSTISYSKQL